MKQLNNGCVKKQHLLRRTDRRTNASDVLINISLPASKKSVGAKRNVMKKKNRNKNPYKQWLRVIGVVSTAKCGGLIERKIVISNIVCPRTSIYGKKKKKKVRKV